jgi:UDP-N-acetylmuramoyl-tripeptide--D-alanyl-D-alanine ligase
MVAAALAPLVLTAADVAAATGATVVAPGTRAIESFSIDSRRLAPGQFFVALSGERFDGAAFAAECLAHGAAGVLVNRSAGLGASLAAVAGGGAVLEADDTLEALQRLGRHVRRASGARVTAITGSAGKTTTKEAAADFLSTKYTVYRNAGNLNNHVGLPLSLLELRTRPEMAVVELGMTHHGEIRRLVELAEPEVRVWTNVGDAHAGHFESLDAIADAKAEILEGTAPASLLVANADDPRVMARLTPFAGRVVTFGLSPSAAVRATVVEDRGVEGTVADVETPAGSARVEVPLVGRGNLMNVLAATAVALEFDVPMAAIAARAAALAPAKHRGERIRLRDGITLVDDSYNSSPSALKRTLEAVGRDRTHGRRVAVLGEMLELGAFAEPLHAECGRAAAAQGVAALVTVGGAAAARMAEAAREAGLAPDAVRHVATSEDAIALLPWLVRPGDLVLVKGSRGIRTDLVVERLAEEWR